MALSSSSAPHSNLNLGPQPRPAAIDQNVIAHKDAQITAAMMDFSNLAIRLNARENENEALKAKVELMCRFEEPSWNHSLLTREK
ncbi:hypothetical protein FH972_007906 [Carpinus fangiana]|uniref:Uncharacterized protein n=1 Tax=Carpinus fangiana TaxID=176857 RepID=A0A5N6QZB8_9ROSI|nr:hypothetical protein FH972_007906 [Carpinus fangiana]